MLAGRTKATRFYAASRYYGSMVQQSDACHNHTTAGAGSLLRLGSVPAGRTSGYLSHLIRVFMASLSTLLERSTHDRASIFLQPIEICLSAERKTD